ncbi:hypothetical protein J6590_004703 [Homalodisca vitripennis]|nr:hypothetical protein J6590_004703 [Homalodisca vitripennis]
MYVFRFRTDTPYLNNETDVDCDYSDHKGYVVFSAMGSFFVPLIVMLYVYARISCVIAGRHKDITAINNPPQVKWPLKSTKQSRKPMASCLEESDLARESSESEEVAVRISSVMTTLPENRLPDRRLRLSDNSTRVSSIRRENKAAQTLSIVVGGFIACWLPFFVAYLIAPFLKPTNIPDELMFVLIWLGWINSAINPFIYAFYSPDFRLAFWRLTVRHCIPRQAACRQLNNSSRQSMHMRDSVLGYPRP